MHRLATSARARPWPRRAAVPHVSAYFSVCTARYRDTCTAAAPVLCLPQSRNLCSPRCWSAERGSLGGERSTETRGGVRPDPDRPLGGVGLRNRPVGDSSCHGHLWFRLVTHGEGRRVAPDPGPGETGPSSSTTTPGHAGSRAGRRRWLRSEARQPSAPRVGVTPLLVGCPAASTSSSGEWDEGAVEVVEASFPADGEVLELVEWGRGLLHDGADLARPMVSGAERRFMGRSAL